MIILERRAGVSSRLIVLLLAALLIEPACSGSTQPATPSTEQQPQGDADDGSAQEEPDAGGALGDGSSTEVVLKMNEFQAKATHNSYHLAKPFFPSDSLNYNHKPLDVQLESQGVRAFELDLHFDSSNRRFDVYHIASDNGSTCPRLSDCLQKLKSWSDAHRGHHPFFIQLEVKDSFAAVDANAYYSALEAEILKTWPQERLITPDLVKGSSPSLREAIVERGWPVMDSMRGRALFFISAPDDHRNFYTRGGTNLAGRLLFVAAGSTLPYSAILVMDDPKAEGARIREAVKAGFVVRTRADADLKEPRANDVSRWEAALASGAQLVSTDFPAKDPNYEYIVTIPGGSPSRCNPVLAIPSCTSAMVER
jgi:hypothetical protein